VWFFGCPFALPSVTLGSLRRVLSVVLNGMMGVWKEMVSVRLWFGGRGYPTLQMGGAGFFIYIPKKGRDVCKRLLVFRKRNPFLTAFLPFNWRPALSYWTTSLFSFTELTASRKLNLLKKNHSLVVSTLILYCLDF